MQMKETPMKQLPLNIRLFFILILTFINPLTAVAENTEEKSFTMPKHPVAIIETNQGTFEVTLYPEQAPKTVENFLRLAQNKYYDGIIFHRVIKGFMIQGGDPEGTGTGGQSIWGKNFEDEFDPSLTFSTPGLLAMANRGPGTNGSQFFITVAPTPWLTNKHTIFGKVTKGYDVIQQIEKTQTGPADKPVETQKIIKITVIDKPS
jgi:peptidylprolyl isomerase